MDMGLTLKRFLVILVMTSFCNVTMVAGLPWLTNKNTNTVVVKNNFLLNEKLGGDETPTSIGWPMKSTVVIENNFHSNEKSLYVHCYSKDNDIGEHWLAVGEKLSWSFRPNIWGSTHFDCYAQWGNKKKYFEAYDLVGYQCCADKGSITWFLKEDGLLAVMNDPKNKIQNKVIKHSDWD